MSKYERIAPREGGAAEYLLLKETLEKVERGSLSESLEQKIDSLLEEFKLSREQRVAEIDKISQAITSISVEVPEQDITGIIANVIEAVSAKPSYNFNIERNSSGLLTNITATPID